MRRRRLGAVVTAFVVAAAPVALATDSAEATSYRFWSFWSVADSAWKFAQVGPSMLRPKDGEVQGWRFAVTTDSSSAARPRLTAATAFSDVCGSTTRPENKKRVALVVDFGTAADAPADDAVPAEPLRGECVVTDTGADGWDVLVAAGYAIRADAGGMVCALAGYPKKGCGVTVAAPPKTQEPAPDAGGAAPATSSGGGSAGGRKKDRKTNEKASADSGGSADKGARSTRTAPTTAPTSDATTAADDDAGASTDASPTSTPPAAEGTQDAGPTPSLVPGVPEPVAANTDGTGGAAGTALGVLLLGALAGAGAFAAYRRRRA